jgi:predicted DNA-binding protein YlxM (UPF0122 family)
MPLRKGREVYTAKYRKSLELYKQGFSVKQIAQQLNISYSAVYHWIKGLRKPKSGQLDKFLAYVKRAPVPQAVISNKFPKHNELYHIAISRKLPINRKILPTKFGEYRIWYYTTGQEKALKSSIQELKQKYAKLIKKLVMK